MHRTDDPRARAGRERHHTEPDRSSTTDPARPGASDGRAQSEAIGVVLLIGLTVLGTATVVVLGATTLDESRSQATVERIEDSMTAFDARSVKVALGDAPAQTIDFGGTDRGRYAVEPDAGWIRVVHRNYSTGSDDDEPLYNATLGALVYRNGDVEIAYQGGGVWRRTGNGSVLVSPPEFHYRDETLTLPLVLTRGGSYAGGATRAVVSPASPSRAIYPDATTLYDDGSRAYANPVQNGMVNVTVKSAYYEAWAEYFRTKTEGAVDVDPASQTVTLELTAGGTQGDFQMPPDGSSIDVRGLAPGHTVENFTISLAPDDTDAANFDNMQWAMFVDSGRYELEFNIRKSGEDPHAPDCADEEFSLTVYFSDQNGDPYHGWYTDTIARNECTDRDGDGVADETRLDINFTGLTRMETTDVSRTDVTHFNPSGSSRPGTYDFDEHQGSVVWEPATFSDGGDDDTTVANLTNHYFGRLGRNFDLTVDDKNSDTVSEDASEGTLIYDAEGRVTYMHITENPIQVRLEA